jgi:hypothetical protein
MSSTNHTVRVIARNASTLDFESFFGGGRVRSEALLRLAVDYRRAETAANLEEQARHVSPA